MPIKFSEIVPGKLYQRGTFDHIPLVERVRELTARRITTILNVCDRVDEDLFLYVNYIQFPLPDNSQFIHRIDEIQAMAKERAAKIASGEERTLVHCWYGRNRSGLVNALILRHLYGLTGAEALTRLRTVRPGAVGGNKFFVRYLDELGAP